jgi:hypothetical protein
MVTVRPYKRGGWEVDLRVVLPDGSEHRQRRRAPVSTKSAAQRWGEERERYWYRELTQPTPEPVEKEVPLLESFASRLSTDTPEPTDTRRAGSRRRSQFFASI